MSPTSYIPDIPDSPDFRRLRLGFAGTPEFAAVALQRLLDAGCTVPVVFTQPDRPAGRGMKLTPSAVKVLAQKHDIPVLQPHSLNRKHKNAEYAQQAKEAEAQLRALNLDALVVAAYGLILPQWVLDTPRFGCLNIHASLLPRWRGAAPIHRAIEAGDAETGICIMQMDRGLDTGDVLLREALPIDTADTTATLHDKLAALGGEAIVQAAQLLAQGKLNPEPQSEQGISYAHKIEKAEAQVDWSLSAEAIARKVRAFNPFPVAHTTMPLMAQNAQVKPAVVRLWQAHAIDNNTQSETSQTTEAGTVLSADESGVCIQCGHGVLRITELQKRGGKRLPVADFLRGSAVDVGAVCGADAV